MSAMHVAAAVVIVATALVHSLLGERRVIAPLRSIDPAVLVPRVRRALHFTWHVSSLYLLLVALAVAWPGTPELLVRLIGFVFVALALLSAWLSKGRHISGPLYASAGALALLS